MAGQKNHGQYLTTITKITQLFLLSKKDNLIGKEPDVFTRKYALLNNILIQKLGRDFYKKLNSAINCNSLMAVA